MGMTNGEKMQVVFPDIEILGESKYQIYSSIDGNMIDILEYSLGGMIHRVTKSWWNGEYKEPITENCIACKYNESEEEDGSN